jgi:hypothetical protein
MENADSMQDADKSAVRCVEDKAAALCRSNEFNERRATVLPSIYHAVDSRRRSNI